MATTEQPPTPTVTCSTPGSSLYPGLPALTHYPTLGDVCGSCGDYVPGGAHPDVMAAHVCEPEPCP